MTPIVYPLFVSSLFVLLGFALVGLTIDIIVNELTRRSPDTVPRHWLTLLRVLRVLVSCLFFVGLAWYFHSAITILIVVLAAGLYVRSVFSRRRDEVESANQLLRLVADHGGSVPDAMETFAPSCSSIVYQRVRDFAYHLRCGMDLESAARRSRLSLMPDTVVALQFAGGAATRPPVKNQGPQTELSDQSLGTEGSWLSWPASGQLLYLLILFVFAVLAGSFLVKSIFPMFQDLLDEGGITNSRAEILLRMTRQHWAQIVVPMLVVAVIWLVLVILTAIHPIPLMTRITPWFGDWVRQRNRWSGLRSLAAGLRRGESLATLLDAGTKTPRSRWIRRRSRVALAGIQRGETTADALQQADWISRAEARWLSAAEANQALPQAMESLTLQIRRHYDLLWQFRLAWLVPTATLAVAAFVLLQALILFLLMTELIYGIA